MPDLGDIFEELERNSEEYTFVPGATRDKVLRAPFGYPGGKSRSVFAIIPRLPYRGKYVEPFGGSAAVLLARRPSKLEVYNDRYGGVVSFYRCLRNANLLSQLCDRLELTVHSREEWIWSAETWEDAQDDVERAARWFYMTQYSFGSLGRNWGRGTSATSRVAGKIRNKIATFPAVHERLKHVQIENQDWFNCMIDYDSPDTVFYLDPPYVDANECFKIRMGEDEHLKMLDTIFKTRGFVALSGYPNPLFDERDWDEIYEWASYVSIQSIGHGVGGTKEHLKNLEKRGHGIECLYVKESR